MMTKLNQNRIGEVLAPKAWKLIKIKDLGSYRRGSFPQPYGLNKWYDDVAGDPFVQVFDVENSLLKLKPETQKKISEAAKPMSVFVKKGSVVVTINGSVGRVALTQYDSFIDRTLLVFEDFRVPINKDYFKYALFIVFQKEKEKAPGEILRTITKEHLSDFEVLIPPLPEQRAIAKVLSDVDALIEAQEALIEKKRLIKQGVMQELLTGKRRLPGFSGEWMKIYLSKILDYEQPGEYVIRIEKPMSTGSIPVLTPGKTFVLGYTNEKSGVYRNLPVILFDDFTTASRYVDFPFKVDSSAVKMLTCKTENFNLHFVFEKMQLIKFPIGNHKRYYISEYQNMEVTMPEIEEQNAISSVLLDMDREITTLERGLEKYKLIKNGMMQELLTGQTRLV